MTRRGKEEWKHMVSEERESLTCAQAALEALQDNAACHAADSAAQAGLGVAIGDLDPGSLKVHPRPVSPAGHADGGRLSSLPGYVPRPHDRVLADLVEAALGGQSGILFMVGESSTGKTRACWEAVQPLAEQGWRLWHPYEPTHVDATLAELEQVGPRTVIWLYEAQRHLIPPPGSDGRISAALLALLSDPARTPVLVLGTLSPANHRRYVTHPAEYPHAQDLLAARTSRVPKAFDPAATKALTRLAESDSVLADALGQAQDGQVAQYLSGAPILVERFQNASAPARAVLAAAMDFVRLGVDPHVPAACLAEAAEGYLSESELEGAPGNWFAEGLAEATTTPTGADVAPLRLRALCTADGHGPAPSSAGPFYQLASYLEQHARTARRALCPPASFWQAAGDHLTDPHHLSTLAYAALERHRLRWSERLAQKAAHGGEAYALHQLAERQQMAGDRKDAERLFRQAADHGYIWALIVLALLREEAGDHHDAERLLTQAGDHGEAYALMLLAERREKAGDRHQAERLAQQAADHGDTSALYRLAEMREEAGDPHDAERLVQQAAHHGNLSPLYDLAMQRIGVADTSGAEPLFAQAADHGDTRALYWLAQMREKAGDHHEAERLAQQAADHGNTSAIWGLAEMREDGDRQEAERLALQAADLGEPSALGSLAQMREEAGDHHSAERLAQQAAHYGDTNTLHTLAMMREHAGDRQEAERLALQTADHGDTSALWGLAMMWEEDGDRQEAERLALQAVDHGDTDGLCLLASLREEAGDAHEAERLLTQAADHGGTRAMIRLAEMREKAGDRHEAERLALQAADHGAGAAHFFSSLWPHGLEADGTRSLPLRYASWARTPERRSQAANAPQR
ncbi:transcriptional regulator [Streptomyces sp. NPDC040724]|uniref:tetratricopeptide repeat protein n=1 Tax=Streptomyces sp. NPDC040724 TaxID=3155612 RepID=UPI0034052B82